MINLAIQKNITTSLLVLLVPPLMIILDRRNFPKRKELFSNPKVWHDHPYFLHSSHHHQKIKKENLSKRFFFHIASRPENYNTPILQQLKHSFHIAAAVETAATPNHTVWPRRQKDTIN
jgi:hypothetical protein